MTSLAQRWGAGLALALVACGGESGDGPTPNASPGAGGASQADAAGAAGCQTIDPVKGLPGGQGPLVPPLCPTPHEAPPPGEVASGSLPGPSPSPVSLGPPAAREWLCNQDAEHRGGWYPGGPCDGLQCGARCDSDVARVCAEFGHPAGDCAGLVFRCARNNLCLPTED